ncbi:MAG: DUF3078 domain-containing protein [Bacteroidales bacterium]|jgi:hypothetical protein|nr:DUF3078 domain-containing protein [Bacteroidales bacterium]
MKHKLLLLITLSVLSIGLKAQDAVSPAAENTLKDTVKHWKKSNTIIFTTEQTYYNNWSAGGFSSFSFSGYYKAFYNYLNGKNKWDNTFDLGYGQMIQDVTGNGFKDPANHFQKSEDKIDINSIYGYKLFSDWYASALLNLKSQFDNGFKYENGDTILVASTFSPAVLTSSIGLEYKKSYFSALFSFLTGKTTFVSDNRLLTSGVLGYTTPDENWYFSLGSFVKFFFQKDIFTNINLLAKLEFFYDYNKPFLDTDISGEIFLNMKINKYLNAFISIQAILDHDFNETVQFKERFGLSIPITF